MAKKDIECLPTKIPIAENLTTQEKRALSRLKSNSDFIIREADKGGKIVLWPHDLYIKEAHRQLDNPRCTGVYSTKLRTLIDKALDLGIINIGEQDFIWVKHPITSTFYMLPKPLVLELPSYIKDSSHFISSLQNITLAPVSFLDLNMMCQDGTLSTCLYRKPTATNNLLEFRSFHPFHTKKGIPVGQFLRTRRNCTRDEDFYREAQDLTERFKKRTYPNKHISHAYQRAKRQSQVSLLEPRKKPPDKTVRFITGFTTHWSKMSSSAMINAKKETKRAIEYLKINIAKKWRESGVIFILPTPVTCQIKLTFQVMYRRPDILQTIPMDVRQTFQDLLELLEENESGSNRRRFPYRNKSLKTPSFSLVPAIKIFFEVVKQDIMAMPIRLAIISPQEKQYLWVANPVTATFYMLPKIHKDSSRPPGRPIVSSVGSMCERAVTHWVRIRPSALYSLASRRGSIHPVFSYTLWLDISHDEFSHPQPSLQTSIFSALLPLKIQVSL
ncbi:unnamed protein product [Ranitomeya imitator]|uniref:Helix-turn-helix domain-containing protein n=1 Tax=Ranitomeya imitator TaxID=111125 RepID=A0ABN9LJZ3_9NEOB|nr:unnamed protein product [Ranitomeya imitator]